MCSPEGHALLAFRVRPLIDLRTDDSRRGAHPADPQGIGRVIPPWQHDLVDLVFGMGLRAQEIVPESVGLTLALFDEGLTFTLVASAEEIAALDAVQYLDCGPCMDAVHDDETIEA